MRVVIAGFVVLVSLAAPIAIDALDASDGPIAPPVAGPPLEEPGTCDVRVGAGGDLQAALGSSPAGAVVCVEGTHRVGAPVRPKAGQTIVGPAEIRPRPGVFVLDGIELKTGHGQGVEDVTLIDLDVAGFRRHGVGCWRGTTVVGGRLHHNGKDGIGCDLEGGGGVLVDGAEIDRNGSTRYLGCCAAGIKWYHAHGVTVRNSSIHDNLGNGVWCDAQCGDFTVTDNVIAANTRKGVFYEKGGGSTIRGVSYEGTMTVTGNLIDGNATDGRARADAGISIISAKNVLVAGNTIVDTGTGDAIRVRDDPARLVDDRPGWAVENVTLTNNDTGNEAIVGCDLPGVECEANG